MDYYKQLYDINFFGHSTYSAQAGRASVVVLEPGTPDWKSWRSPRLSPEPAEALWQKARDEPGVLTPLDLRDITGARADKLLLTLLLCEDAYRRFDAKAFFPLNRALYSSGDEELALKATKLQYAWRSIELLSPLASSTDRPPLSLVMDDTLHYLAGVSGVPQPYTASDFKVEVPVRNDWVRRQMSLNDPQAVEDFYRTTLSYILELTAANYQVQTLFNYAVIIDLLKRSGVREIFDYGAGIGTFSQLAYANGISSTHADLDSETMFFAQNRYERLGLNIPTIRIDPKDPKLPATAECIVCTEVLEHIFDPEKLVREMHAALRPGGILVVSESFDYVDEFCTHLPMHRGQGGRKFLEFMNSVGFREMPTGHLLHPTVHLKL